MTTVARPGRIILLNSESVGGAAVQIAQALQALSPEPVLHLGLATLLSYIAPPLYVTGIAAADGIALEAVPSSDPPQIGVVRGPVGQQLYQALHEMVASLSRSGFSVVVDHAVDTAFVAIDFQMRTEGLPVHRVGLYHAHTAPDGGHPRNTDIDLPWQAPEVDRWLAQRVHRGIEEDLTLDLRETTPDAAAARILRLPPEAGSTSTAPRVSLMTEPGRVIVLNGPTSSGKSSTARAIQSLAREPYFQVGGDLMINQLLSSSYFVGQERSNEGWSVSPVEGSDPPENAVLWGPVAVESFRALHRCVADLARMGCNVVMDHGLLDKRVNDDFRTLMDEVSLFFVGLHASLETILSRRAPRMDYSTDPTFVALYRWWHRQAHAHGIPYDLALDSEQLTPEQCSEAILRGLASSSSSV